MLKKVGSEFSSRRSLMRRRMAELPGGASVIAQSSITDGCGTSSICGSFAAELAIGKNLDAVADINRDAVENAIGRLPHDERHCADLAAAALHHLHHFGHLVELLQQLVDRLY